MSLHYHVKGGCSKFLPNTGFTIRLLRFGVKVKMAYCRDNFLAQTPLPDTRALSGDDFFKCFNRMAPWRTVALEPVEKWDGSSPPLPSPPFPSPPLSLPLPLLPSSSPSPSLPSPYK